jgi:nitrite reductase (NADH) large subunit
MSRRCRQRDVCGCVGVTKGAIIEAITTAVLHALAAEGRHAREHRAAELRGLCESLLKAVAPDFSDESRNVLCGWLPFSQDEIRDIIRSQKLRSVQDVLESMATGRGVRSASRH